MKYFTSFNSKKTIKGKHLKNTPYLISEMPEDILGQGEFGIVKKTYNINNKLQ